LSTFSRNKIALILVVIGLLTLAVGCVYYNTFHNCRQAFNEAEKSRTASRGGRANTSGYKRAIEKALKVVEMYPNSKYYDDALYVLTVSYYHTDAFTGCERRAREILANYPESEYAPEVTVYLAKAKLAQGSLDEAMEIFQQIFEEDFKRTYKAEAALGLAGYYFENREYDSAEPYLLAIRDSLGSDEERRQAQVMVADAYFDTYRFSGARSAALQLLAMDPTYGQKYHALKMAAVCSFRLQRFDEGHEYLRQLMDDEVYFDSLGALNLLTASGYEDADDQYQAELIYQKIISEQSKHEYLLEAYWRLGLMYQFDYDDLAKAKEYYDSTSRLGRASAIGKEALQRSSDIGKLESFARTIRIDSSTTQNAIDEAAYTQLQLAELYWFQLNKPDTAMLEMEYIVDSFPTAYDAPKAMIALAGMVREHRADTAAADSLLQEMLIRYPTSDYVPEALEPLGLTGSAADTGYAGKYFHRAEDFLVDQQEIDSARANYQVVVDRFPDSKYYLHARFALIWLTEMYESPGDSSVILAYNEFVDSFPNTEWAAEAKKKTAYRATRRTREADDSEREGPHDEADTIFAAEGDDYEDTTTYVDPLEAVYVGPDGEALGLLYTPYIRIDEPFEYPQEAFREAWQGTMYFQILLDFSGDVEDYIFKIKSPNDEINRRAELAVSTMAWDPAAIPTNLQGQWVVFKFVVYLPDQLR